MNSADFSAVVKSTGLGKTVTHAAVISQKSGTIRGMGCGTENNTLRVDSRG
jgi:hypothetical protein